VVDDDVVVVVVVVVCRVVSQAPKSQSAFFPNQAENYDEWAGKHETILPLVLWLTRQTKKLFFSGELVRPRYFCMSESTYVPF
jgi:hypothetical protein